MHPIDPSIIYTRVWPDQIVARICNSLNQHMLTKSCTKNNNIKLLQTHDMEIKLLQVWAAFIWLPWSCCCFECTEQFSDNPIRGQLDATSGLRVSSAQWATHIDRQCCCCCCCCEFSATHRSTLATNLMRNLIRKLIETPPIDHWLHVVRH